MLYYLCYIFNLNYIFIFYIYIHIYACGPKTVPVKRTFLNIAIVGWSGVGWGGMLTFLVPRTWYIAMLLRSLGSCTNLLRYMLLRCWDLWDRLLRYMLLRCWDLWDRLLRYMLLRCWDLWDRLLRYMLLRCWSRSLGSFTTLHVLCGIWWTSQFPATWVPKVTSWWCMLELGNGDAFTRMLTASW